MEISHLSQSSDRFNCNSFVERDVKFEASGAWKYHEFGALWNKTVDMGERKMIKLNEKSKENQNKIGHSRRLEK